MAIKFVGGSTVSLDDHPKVKRLVDAARKDMNDSQFASYLNGIAQFEEKANKNPELASTLRQMAKDLRQQ